MNRYCRLTLAAGAVALGSVACGEGSTPVVGSDGPAVSIVVAPLDQSGVGVGCFDLEVATALGTLWEKGDPTLNYLQNDLDTICSDDHGNAGGGSIRWVGSCDAQDAADTDPNGRAGVQNAVTLWFDGIYNVAKTAETAGVYDPCGTAGCTLEFDCIANADTLAEFNFTVIRDAENGFFDIAVRFDNIYCASKYDDCYSNNQDITLFSDDDGDHKTGVYALACTAPLGSDVDLHYGNLAVVCSGFTFPINPNVSARTDAASVPAGHSLTYDVFRDQTAVNCDDDTVDPPVTGNCNGLFWNISFDLTDLEGLGTCTLAFSATATNGTGSFVDGLPTNPGSTYPYIDVDATITGGDACQQNPLNGDGSAVVTNYHGDFGLAAVAMCFTYDGSTTTTTGNSTCSALPQAAPLGNVLRAYSAPCNPDAALYPEDSFYAHDSPIECGAGEVCIPGGTYGYGQCVPGTPRICTYEGGCTESVVALTFSRGAGGNPYTIPTGTFISTATDPDSDEATGYQYNYRLTADVVFLADTTQVVGTGILYTQDLAPDDRPNIAAGLLTVIGQSGTPEDWGDIAVTNALATGANPNLRCQLGQRGMGFCVEKGTPQACDDHSLEPHCPAGSYCENQGDGGMCRQKGGEGVRCSTSHASQGIQACQSGLNCISNPSDPQDYEGYCRVPGDEGDVCQANAYGVSQCKPDLYCRYESQSYATCSPRKAVGDFCSIGNQNQGAQAYVGNCAPGLFCGLTYSNNNDMSERKCAVNTPLDDGEACWLSGEQSLRKCKGHCDVDVNNPFENINADGVCRPDVGEGEACHASGESEDYGGYCRRGLYCNDGAGQFQMTMINGTCLPIDEIGGACQRDSMCPVDQLCGSPYNLSQGQSFCVERGCGNRIIEESDLEPVGSGVSPIGDPNADVFEFETLGGPSFAPGDSVKFSLNQGPWQLGVIATVNVDVDPGGNTQITLVDGFGGSGSSSGGQDWVNLVAASHEECDDGMFNCDTIVNGQPVCECSALCMAQ